MGSIKLFKVLKSPAVIEKNALLWLLSDLTDEPSVEAPPDLYIRDEHLLRQLDPVLPGNQ